MQRPGTHLVRSARAVLLLLAGFFIASGALAQTPIPNTGSYASGQTVYNGGLVNASSQPIPGCIACHGTPLPNSATTGVGGSNITAANSVANIQSQIASQYLGDGSTCNSGDMSQFAAGCANVLSSTDLANVAAYIGGYTAPISANGAMASTYNSATTYALDTNNLINNTTNPVGTATGIQIVTQPTHGTAAVVAGTFTVKYTPATNYNGNDSFTYEAVNNAGPAPFYSNVSTITVTMGAIITPPPQAAMTSATVPYNQSAVIDLTSSIAGSVTSIIITSPPANGTATISGLKVTYTPKNGFSGLDSFAYEAKGPGGSSAAAVVSLTVSTLAAHALNATMTVNLNQLGTINLANFVTGSGITGAVLVGAPAHGTALVSGTTMSYQPVNNYFGADRLTYRAFGSTGPSNIAVVTINVIGRPDPTRDSDIQAIVASQEASAVRSARVQIDNFQSHLATLHARSIDDEDAIGGEGGPGQGGSKPDARGYSANPGLLAPVASATSPSAISPTTIPSLASLIRGDAVLPGTVPFNGAVMEHTAYFPGTPPVIGSSSAPVAQTVSSIDIGSLAGSMIEGPNGANPNLRGFSSVWVLGSVNFGERTPGGPTEQFDTDGVSMGVDYRLSPEFVVGLGAGYARDKTAIGNDGSRTRSTGANLVAYSSYAPTSHTFIDALVGYGSLDLDASRAVVPIDAMASSHRSGDQVLGSLAAGYEWHANGAHVTPYVRLDASRTSLDQTTEDGAAAYNLNYAKQNQSSIAAALGLRLDTTQNFDAGVVRPHIGAEYRHEFENDSIATLSYADLPGTTYGITPGVLDRNTVSLGFGADFITRHGLSVGWDYEVIRAAGIENSQVIRIKMSQDLDQNFVLPLVAIRPLADIRADLAYTDDDNVARSTDKLSDQFWSLDFSRVLVMPFNENSRITLTPSAGFDKFEHWVGLSHADAGLKAQLQYRTSGDFSAPTYALFANLSGSNYESTLRDGEQLQLGGSFFMPLTDRINGFVALGANGRHARSNVFDGGYGFVRANLDYALSESGTLYLSGEYRNGDLVSSGLPSLANLDSAKEYVEDDAFPNTGRIAYRFKGTTGIFSLGYNLGISSTSSVDVSYRLVTSSPNQEPEYDTAPTVRYTDHQVSLVYLVRF